MRSTIISRAFISEKHVIYVITCNLVDVNIIVKCFNNCLKMVTSNNLGLIFCAVQFFFRFYSISTICRYH